MIAKMKALRINRYLTTGVGAGYIDNYLRRQDNLPVYKRLRDGLFRLRLSEEARYLSQGTFNVQAKKEASLLKLLIHHIEFVLHEYFAPVGRNAGLFAGEKAVDQRPHLGDIEQLAAAGRRTASKSLGHPGMSV